MKNKYYIEKGFWKVAQTFDQESKVNTNSYDGSWWTGANYTPIRSYIQGNGIEKAKALLQNAYGPDLKGEGQLIKNLRALAQIYKHIDDDFPGNINNIIEDLYEVREENINVIKEMTDAQQAAQNAERTTQDLGSLTPSSNSQQSGSGTSPGNNFKKTTGRSKGTK